MLLRLIFIAAVCVVCSSSFAAEQQVNRVTGIYSNLAYNNESGDLSGMELLIVPSGHGPDAAYSVFVQISEGGAPYTAVVPLKLKGINIEFTLPADSEYPRQHFVGTLNGAQLDLRWNSEVEHLKRGKSYWQ
jgi:hypothetical protein